MHSTKYSLCSSTYQITLHYSLYCSYPCTVCSNITFPVQCWYTALLRTCNNLAVDLDAVLDKKQLHQQSCASHYLSSWHDIEIYITFFTSHRGFHYLSSLRITEIYMVSAPVLFMTPSLMLFNLPVTEINIISVLCMSLKNTWSQNFKCHRNLHISFLYIFSFLHKILHYFTPYMSPKFTFYFPVYITSILQM